MSGSSKTNEELLAKVEAAEPGKQVEQWSTMFDRYAGEIEKVLPASMTIEAFQRIATTTINTNAQLKQCTPTSILTALMRCAELGMEPGPLGYVWFVPRKDRGVLKCNLQIGYFGWMELARRSGQIAKIECRAVYDDDEFDWEFGSNEFLRHKPSTAPHGLLGRAKDARTPVAVYAIAKLTTGETQFEVMQWADAMAYRAVYAKTDKVWKSNPVEMALKTVFLRLKTWLPRSIEMDRATKVDDIGAIPDEEPAIAEIVDQEPVSETVEPVDHKAQLSHVVAAMEADQWADFEAWSQGQSMPLTVSDYSQEQAETAVETWGWVTDGTKPETEK